MADRGNGPVPQEENRGGGSLSPKAWIAIVAIICVTALGITALILYAGSTNKTPTGETTSTTTTTTTTTTTRTPRTVPTTTTTTTSPPPTTEAPTTTTLPPPATVATTAAITYGGPTGQIVWQSGQAVTASATVSTAS